MPRQSSGLTNETYGTLVVGRHPVGKPPAGNTKRPCGLSLRTSSLDHPRRESSRSDTGSTECYHPSGKNTPRVKTEWNFFFCAIGCFQVFDVFLVIVAVVVVVVLVVVFVLVVAVVVFVVAADVDVVVVVNVDVRAPALKLPRVHPVRVVRNTHMFFEIVVCFPHKPSAGRRG